MPFILTLILTCQLSTTPLQASQIIAVPQSESGIVQIEDLNDLLEPIRVAAGLPALAALVLEKGEIRALGAVGYRKYGEEVKVTVDDHFHLGSDTKAMTATLAAILVEEGLIRWESTISEVLPDLTGSIDEAYHDVSLRQLFMHRGGCPNQTVPPGTNLSQLHNLPGDTMVKQRLRYVTLFLTGKPQAKPGRRYIYSNGGYVTAGAMLERVTGRSWEELIQAKLFTPLGITSAGFGAMGSPGEIDQPWQHLLRNEIPYPVEPGPYSDNPLVIGPAGTVHMSLSDWSRFVAAHLSGRAGEHDLLKQETWELLHERPEEGRYAMGWMVVERPWAEGEALSHAGSNTANYALVWASVKRQFAVLVVTNIGHDLVAGVCDQLTGALIEKYPPGG
jgi:CubicO group peptidase (beta-lactamase class C family)